MFRAGVEMYHTIQANDSFHVCFILVRLGTFAICTIGNAALRNVTLDWDIALEVWESFRFHFISSSCRIYGLTRIASMLKGEKQRSLHRKRQRSRLAAAHVARVQAGVTDGVLVAQPGEETLEAETVSTVRRGAVSVRRKVLVYRSI